MQMKGERQLPVARDRVWEALFDTETLRTAMPGCESVIDEGSGAYRVVVVAAVGPVKARFKGRLQQQDLDPPNRYTLSFEGDGGMAGFARGTAEVELSEPPEASGQTRLVYRTQAQIGGRLAQIGSRLVDATAARMSAQFFQRLEQAIVSGAAEPAVVSPVAATSAGPAGKAAGEKPATNVAPGSVARPAIGAGVEDAVPAPPAPVMPPAPGAYQPGALVTLQMPAWTWAFTVAVTISRSNLAAAQAVSPPGSDAQSEASACFSGAGAGARAMR